MVAIAPGQTGGLEVELKFELSSGQARKLCLSPQIKALQEAPPRRASLRAIYFDTPDQKLLQRGVSLRVRKESRYFVQCVKTNAQGETMEGFSRREWEWRVPGPDFDPLLLQSDDDLKALFKGVNTRKLQAVFTTDVRRQKRVLVTPGGARIKCDLDQGRVLAGGREENLHELELELEHGSLAELLSLGSLVTQIVPARLSARTKAHRGYTLFRNQGHPWVRAAAAKLPENPTARDVLHISVFEGLKHLIANEDCVLSRTHIEGVHQMRVATRRMRSLIVTYKKLLVPGSYEHLSQGLKDAGSALGPARDWDVFLHELLPPVEAGFDGEPVLALLRARAKRRQTAAYVRADRLIRSDDYAKLLTETLQWVGSMAESPAQETLGEAKKEPANALASPARDIAKTILARRHARLLKAGKGLKHMPVEQRHQLRIAIKKARYAAEFFAGLYPPKSTKSYIAVLRALQDGLGHLNDLATAQRLMADLARTTRGADAGAIHRASGMVEGWYTHAQSVRENDLLKAWSRFTKAKTFW